MSENGTLKTLAPAQRKAIEALLTCGNVASAALAADVGRTTIYRWMKEDLFTSELRIAEQEAVAGLARALAGLGDSAAEALRAALQPDQKMSVRLRASEVVIGNLLRLRELVELEARISALEAGNAK